MKMLAIALTVLWVVPGTATPKTVIRGTVWQDRVNAHTIKGAVISAEVDASKPVATEKDGKFEIRFADDSVWALNVTFENEAVLNRFQLTASAITKSKAAIGGLQIVLCRKDDLAAAAGYYMRYLSQLVIQGEMNRRKAARVGVPYRKDEALQMLAHSERAQAVVEQMGALLLDLFHDKAPPEAMNAMRMFADGHGDESLQLLTRELVRSRLQDAVKNGTENDVEHWVEVYLFRIALLACRLDFKECDLEVDDLTGLAPGAWVAHCGAAEYLSVATDSQVLKKACKEIEKGLEQARKSGNFDRIATTLREVRDIYGYVGDTIEQNEEIERALKAARELLAMLESVAHANGKELLPQIAEASLEVGILLEYKAATLEDVEKRKSLWTEARAKYVAALRTDRDLAPSRWASELQLAYVLTHLSSLDMAGQEEDLKHARDELDEAMGLWRELASQDPGRYLLKLAGATGDLSSMENTLHNAEAAGLWANESVAAYLELTHLYPGMYEEETKRARKIAKIRNRH